MKMRFAPATLAALLALFSTASADVQIADTGYQETKAGKALSLRRVFTIDTGKKTFVLQSNGVSIGYVNSSWHQNEVCAVDVNGEKFFEFTDIASARNEFQDRIAFTVTPGKESGTIAAAWEGQRAKVTLAYAARANDDKLEITVKVTPKQTLWATTVAFECYPSAGGPRHKLSRAVATAKRAEVLPPWEDEKRVDLARDERWALFYDNQIDLGTPVVADQKGRGGCALVYAPEDATEAWIKVGAVHIDSRFRYGPDVTEMRFAVLDFQNEKSNAAGLAYMKTLEETGYRIAGTRPARPAAAAKAPVAPAPVVERRPYPLLPGGALPLVTDGNSAYSIHHSPAAPTSVRAAAKELQRVIAIATGATLPVRTEPVAPMICVGDGPASQAAGISGEDLPYGSYRVRTVGENLYIVGRDLPDGERTPFSGVSLGTRFGVSAFLERVVGARWIMPGDIGEEIPRRQTLAVAPIDLYEAPAFDYRTLTITDAPIVREWALRQKVSTASGGGNYASSFIVMANHSWDEFMPKGLRDAHPEWDAVDGEINKFCTRRPEAIRAFAENAVLWLKRNPNARMVQVSPSDGQIFCRCAQCRRFTVKDPHGQESVTLNILDSYNDVARVVAQERPGCMVGGFAYGLCTYPPAVPVALEPNVLIQWTPLNYYGMGLYKPAYRDEFERVAAQWRALTPNVTYWNYCHWHRSESGAPYAPALPIMKLQFPVLKKYGYRGVTEDGSANWCYGGPNNYLLAKLLWDANADVDALYREWLALAYGEGADAIHTGRLVPVYPKAEGIGERWLRRLMKQCVDEYARQVPEFLPARMVASTGFPDRGSALAAIHFPESPEVLASARRRLAFDELLLLQMNILARRARWRGGPAGFPVVDREGRVEQFVAGLPYALTGAQRRSLAEILQDIAAPTPMCRLLQGDVGSGKTIVAAAAAFAAVASGRQVAVMAPTEILAEQHNRTFRSLFSRPEARVDGQNVEVALLTGNLRKSDRTAIQARVASGDVALVIGTHALIQESVDFASLGLVIVDEQHRFGVLQREALRKKGTSPHLLVMTATPIPRSLALTTFGDLDLSVIDEMPPGRQTIRTRCFGPNDRDQLYTSVRAEIAAGHQAYVICPLVEESDRLEAKAATAEYDRLRQTVFSGCRVGLLHGRLKGDDKEAVMRAFQRGELDVLVSTAVVEVGIDVPNATCIIIEGAERFGLSQLHQFRGRVGRGSAPAYCALLTDTTSTDALERLQVLVNTSDGFELAEQDLRLRGPGEFFGTRQSGLPDLRLASVTDIALVTQARALATDLYANDPTLAALEHRPLAEEVARFWNAGQVN